LRLLAGPRKGLHAAIIDYHTIRLPFPTWSWVSWRGGVEYKAKCEEEVKGLVEWHQSAHYAVNPANPFSSPWRELANYDIPSSAHNEEPIRSPDAIMDERALGFLRFTAASANFDLEIEDLNIDGNHPEDCALCREWVLCQIRARTGKRVGTIWVPISWLEAHSDNRAEFILLSMHIKDVESETCKEVFENSDPRYPDTRISGGVKHMDGCDHQSQYNIMLIDWKEGPHCAVAVRIGITQIHKDDWVEADANSKLILLS